MANQLQQVLSEFNKELLGHLAEISDALKKAAVSVDKAIQAGIERNADLVQKHKQGIKPDAQPKADVPPTMPTNRFGRSRGG